MATSLDYVRYVCDQLAGVGILRFRKMFGEYVIYVNEKPILLVCDNAVFIRKAPELAERMQSAETGIPYPGAKERFLLDVEDSVCCREVVSLLEAITPLPKPKKKKKDCIE